MLTENKLEVRKPRSKMTEEERLVAKQRREDYENNVTEQEFKEDLRYRMEQDALHPHCDCEICQEAHKKFDDTPDMFLEERWLGYLEQINRKPCTDEEIDAVFAKYGLVIDRKTGRVNSL